MAFKLYVVGVKCFFHLPCWFLIKQTFIQFAIFLMHVNLDLFCGVMVCWWSATYHMAYLYYASQTEQMSGGGTFLSNLPEAGGLCLALSFSDGVGEIISFSFAIQ